MVWDQSVSSGLARLFGVTARMIGISGKAAIRKSAFFFKGGSSISLSHCEHPGKSDDNQSPEREPEAPIRRPGMSVGFDSGGGFKPIPKWRTCERDDKSERHACEKPEDIWNDSSHA
jgi:hypothetical protein